jgi:hypothetical protein
VEAAWLDEGGVSIDYTPQMAIRERTVWLTDHPGSRVEDFDRVRRPFDSVHGGQHGRQRKAYLDWL